MAAATVVGSVAGYYTFRAPPMLEPLNPYQIVDNDMSDAQIAAARERGEVTRLTDGEEAMAYKIFGDTINLDDVYVRFSDEECTSFLWFHHTLAWVGGYDGPGIGDKTMTFCTYREADYSADIPARKRDTFMHELTHVWQNQNDIGFWCKTYSYPLRDFLHLRNYCGEQQAEIISDYSSRFAFGDKAGKPIKTNDDYNLARIVEDVLPQARITRYHAEIDYSRVPN